MSPRFLLLLAVLALTCWLLAVAGFRRHRPVRGTLAAVLALLVSAGFGADLVNARYGYLPRLADVVGSRSWPSVRLADLRPRLVGNVERPKGGVVTLSVRGTASRFGRHPVLAYLPPQYFTEPGARFPVVYLLHGSPGSAYDWFRAGKAADAGLAVARAGQPVILVAAPVSSSWSDDSECVDRPSEHIETWLVRDVVPAVDRLLRTRADRLDRATAGLSAGGFCALNLALRHRELFGAVLDMSGYSRPTHDGGPRALFGRRPDLAAVVTANTPADYLPDLRPDPAMRVRLDVGRADAESRRDMTGLVAQLAGRGFEVDFRMRPGGHGYDVWRPALREGLAWLAEGFAGAGASRPVGLMSVPAAAAVSPPS